MKNKNKNKRCALKKVHYFLTKRDEAQKRGGDENHPLGLIFIVFIATTFLAIRVPLIFSRETKKMGNGGFDNRMVR